MNKEPPTSLESYVDSLPDNKFKFLVDVLEKFRLLNKPLAKDLEFIKKIVAEEEKNPNVMCLNSPEELTTYFSIPEARRADYLNYPDNREMIKAAKTVQEPRPAPAEDDQHFTTPQQKNFYNRLRETNIQHANFYRRLSSDAKDIYEKLSPTQRERYQDTPTINSALGELFFNEKNELILQSFPQAVDIVLRRKESSDKLIMILNNLIHKNIYGLNAFYTNLFMSPSRPLLLTERLIDIDVAVHNEKIKKIIEKLADITDSYSIQELLTRYGTDDIVQRATCDSSSCNWSTIENNVLELSNFYIKKSLQRDWMNAIAESYTSGCVNQPYFGVMVLAAGRMLTTDKNNQDDIPEGLIFLYILQKAKEIVYKNKNIKQYLEAEATNLLVLECLKIRELVTEKKLALEPTIVNEGLLDNSAKEWISDQAKDLARVTCTLNNHDIAQFLKSDVAIEARTVWAGAVLPNIVGGIKKEFKAKERKLQNLYLRLGDDGAETQNKALDEIKDLYPNSGIFKKGDCTIEETVEAAKKMVFNQMKTLHLEESTKINSVIHEKIGSLIEVEVQKNVTMFKDLLATRRAVLTGLLSKKNSG